MTRMTRWLWDWAKTIVVVLAVWFLVSSFVVQAFHITSSSMESTLLVGDVLFANKLLYGAQIPVLGGHLPAIRDPQRNEIVTFESVETPGLTVVKRLVGMPGDTLAMRDGLLLRNGVPVEEPWVASDHRLAGTDPAGLETMRRWQVRYLTAGDSASYHPDPNTWGPIAVPPGSYFMMGDNRRDSWDSRFWGLLPRSHIQGRPMIVYYSYDPDTYKPLPLLTNTRWRRLFSVPR